MVVLLVVGMHIGILLIMNIFFHASTYFLLILGPPWHHVIDYMLDRVRTPVPSA
ncbi:hypothetical protein [Salinibacter ruber]|uniref:hypothetical protein n=1 Tax=Salinibacter ruber TaxID=146919 RepID=UPI002167313B|nr:hypothetical protein [Salinibacter ruber]MCS4200966.1 hypothetical protein [Salinibacter ruber]